MTINKIYSNLDTLKVVDKKKSKADKVDSRNKTDKTDSNEKVSDSQFKISEKAKKLQETESLLRFALDKIHELDDIRSDKLLEVHQKIDQDFYSSAEIEDKISRELVSEEELQSIVSQNKKIDNFVKDLKNIDLDEEFIDQERINDIKEKVDSGFYDNPDVLKNLADRIIESFS